MITAEIDDEGNHNVLLALKTPSIYLDTCAIRILAEDTKRGQRFVNALHKHKGTLTISYANVVEIGRMTHCLPLIKHFLDQVGTAWFPIDCDPTRVMEREDINSPQPPCLDVKFAREYYPQTHEHPTLSKLIDLVSGDKVKYDALHAMVLPLAEEIIRDRDLFKKRDPRVNQDLYLNPTFDPQRPTPYVYNGLMRYVFESEMNIDANDIFDIWHCATALAYINIIVTDKTWCNVAKTRLKNLPWDERRIFSPKTLDEFLDTMENLTCK